MKNLWLRTLQLGSRTALRVERFRPYVWRLVVALRERYANVCQPIELETRFDGDIRVRTSLSSHIEAQLFWQGFQEADESTVTLLKRLLPEDGVFVDVGANIGSFTLVAAARAPRGQVHAFEPSSFHFERLCHNISLNRFVNIHINQFGLSNENDELTLHLPESDEGLSNTGGASLFPDTKNSQTSTPETVSLRRLDDYVEEKGLSRLDVIKLDIEGAELLALDGSRHTIDRFRPYALVEVDLANLRRAGTGPEEMLAYWNALDYEMSIIHSADDLQIVHEVSLLGQHQNVICIPRKSKADHA